jgi:hypothetical protein
LQSGLPRHNIKSWAFWAQIQAKESSHQGQLFGTVKIEEKADLDK